jgi:SNF2 family DNA or RNA helicase
VAGDTVQQRTKLTDRFCDRKDSAAVMVCNFRSASLGLNLQKACFRVAMMVMPENVNSVLQVIGRVHRIGQEFEQEIYILGCDDSYDQVLQAKAFRKMIGQLCGEASLELMEFSIDEKEGFRKSILEQKQDVEREKVSLET